MHTNETLPNWIPIRDKIETLVEPILLSKGFVKGTVEADGSYIEYKRLTDQQKTQQINIDAMKWREGENNYRFNWLRVLVHHQNLALNLRDLAPKDPSWDLRTQQGWIYRNEEELTKSVEEIAYLIENNLFAWFSKTEAIV